MGTAKRGVARKGRGWPAGRFTGLVLVLVTGAFGVIWSLGVDAAPPAPERAQDGRERGHLAREAGGGIDAAVVADGAVPGTVAASADAGVSDDWIATRIRRAFGAEAISKGSRLEVVSERSGIVTLSGRASSEAAKARAIEIARETLGVKVVVDLVEVEPAPR